MSRIIARSVTRRAHRARPADYTRRMPSPEYEQLVAALPDGFADPDDSVEQVREKFAGVGGGPPEPDCRVEPTRLGEIDGFWVSAPQSDASRAIQPSGMSLSAGLPGFSVWVYLLELPAAAMAEFGHILPEPGDDPAWTAGLPEDERRRMSAIGARG